MSWKDQLRPASWRGQEFGVWTLGGRFGRDLAVHDYPFRDSVTIEDLGKSGRRYRIRGFLLGDDVIAKEAAMIEAAEQEGSGEFVHPTLGTLTVNCGELSVEWRHDDGQLVELTFFFLDSGTGSSGGLSVVEDLGATVGKWADQLDLSAVGDFARGAGDALKRGVAVVRQVQSTVRGWTSAATGLLGDARSVLGVVGGVVPGLDRTLSRFAAGIRNPLGQVDTAFSTVTGALSRLSSARQTVTRGIERVSKLTELL